MQSARVEVGFEEGVRLDCLVGFWRDFLRP